ncbi:MAG TPA: 23S rRNA (adenine(2503)-C(2))-methyltransferase RlmN [Candidatus Limnocylindrales bacterium]
MSPSDATGEDAGANPVTPAPLAATSRLPRRDARDESAERGQDPATPRPPRRDARDEAAEPETQTASPRPPRRDARDARKVTDPRPGLSGMDDRDLEKWFAAEGQPAYRARQVREAIWKVNAKDADEILTLPAPLRAKLDQAFRVDTIIEDEVKVGDNGMTEKALHLLYDGSLIESVLMHYPARGFGGQGRPLHRERHTLCISSQAGCAVGCPFCATGELGFGRDLETAEIVDQVRHAARRLAKTGRNLTNIVFMGMGEPLLNLNRVLEAVEILADPRKFGLGARHVVVSTSGVVPGIRRLTALGPQFTLAISLHAARDPLRDVLVPLNRRWPVGEVVAAARDHARVTGRRVSYEYVMISGVNDAEVDADALAKLLRGDLAHVNLIPMNPVAHTPWVASSPERVAEFAARVRHGGIGVTIRSNRGQDAGAACGQLAADKAGEPPAPAVAKRRTEIVRQSEIALQGNRSAESLPAGLAGFVGTMKPR